ncbi:MAG: SUMF1/EgtB/PvdO family nonheme iron enzyme [Bythopirellula sp.]|nr:SUMF1/EgtB/PvdO family nonheme iron enzyme [Bythopirellula sp.]
MRLICVALTVVCSLTFLAPPVQAADVPGIVSEDPGNPAAVAIDAEAGGGFMVPYTVTIPDSEISFEMIPIPGGEFLLGSPDSEADRRQDEGPQVRVKVAPFWIGKHEVTWAEYQRFMEQYEIFKKLDELRFTGTRMESAKKQLAQMPKVKEYLDKEALEVDAITCPTPLYDSSFTYGPGEEPQQPAVTMTQFAAKQYTKWLSGISGQQYRLPSEAEWEYAARAGTSTAFSFGDDATPIGEYAWTTDNADYQTHEVGQLKPNPWGLYDMHGNVAEWVLDQYVAKHYARLKDGVTAANAVAWPTKLFPRAIRGGSWLAESPECRSAARYKSDDPEWTLSDPNLPTSPWWFTEEPATGVGFRLVRPLAAMDAELCKKVWDADVKRIQQDVADRLEEGRGVQVSADPRLPGATAELTRSQEVE